MAEFLTDFTSNDDVKPIVFVLSDARGKTAAAVVEAASDQFVDDLITIKQLGNVSTVEMAFDYIEKNHTPDTPIAVFHTIADMNLRRDLRRAFDANGIPSMDLLGPAINVIANLTGDEPQGVSGRRTNIPVEEAK